MNSNSNTVLIVEDEQGVADLYTNWLEASYTVRTAYSGEQGLELLDPDVDVVLLDRRMPGLSGDEVLGRIRQQSGEYQVAMVTAVEPDFDIMKLDFDEYLTKPIAREELESMVDDLLTRNSFEHGLQQYLALASKKATLEEKKTPGELQQSTTYDVLTSELADHRDQFNEQLARLGTRNTGSYLAYSRKRFIIDSVLISLVAVLLIVVHFVIPDARQRILALGSSQSDPLVSYLLTFVHANDAHLYGNMVGYLVSAFLTLILCMRIKAMRWFYLTAPILLTLLPIGTTMLSRNVFELLYPNADPIFIGFSTVSAGFIGFSFLALLIVGRVIYDHRTIVFIGIFIVLVSVNLLLWATHNQLLPVAVLSTLFVLLLLIVDNLNSISFSEGLSELKQMGERILVLLSATALYGMFGVGLFPATELSSSLRINISGHLLGVCLGFGFALVTALISDIFPIKEQLRREGYSLPDRLL